MQANAILGLVRRMLTREAAENQDQEARFEAAERVAEKLRDHLSKRIGREGYRTLLARALVLAGAQYPSLQAVKVGADGALIGLRRNAASAKQEAEGDGNGNDDLEAASALLASLLGLLMTFIGEDLTLRMVGVLWPALSGEDDADEEKERP